jgi:hypothetical protein
MTKVRIPLMIQDPLYAQNKGIDAFEGYDPVREFFLDGPVSKRVAVLDFDPDTGELSQRVNYIPKPRRGWYEDDQGVNIRNYLVEDIYKPAFMQASTFAAVLKTIDLFEKKDAMGRELTWAFDAPQLLVIPRAGKMANAYYHRDTHSLQFFFFPAENGNGRIIYSCLSRDIVAHETAHAIIDGIAPELVDSATPQSLTPPNQLTVQRKNNATELPYRFGRSPGHRPRWNKYVSKKNT